MNKEIFEKYADKLLSAMRREGLMNKEVAAIFDVPAFYMSGMGRHPENVSGPFMEKIRTWAISGKPLREYKLPEAPDVDAAAIRKEYEAVQPQDEIKVVAHKGGKVDVSKLDPRTGQVAAYELQIMDDGSLHISYRFKS